MFHNNYDVTNKSYLDRVQKSYKVEKDPKSKENKYQHNKKQENKKDESKKSSGSPDKGNNIDFFA